MRIIIETDEKAEVTTTLPGRTATDSSPALDGGAPSAALLESIAKVLPAPTKPISGGAVDAGGPPAWLTSMLPGKATVEGKPASSISDGGAAPA
jgi:hypothetical protein